VTTTAPHRPPQPASGSRPGSAPRFTAPLPPRSEEVLTPKAMELLASLHRRFNPTRLVLLQRRDHIQEKLDAGHLPEFLPETRSVRDGDWRIAPSPQDLQDRRVEITGPVDRKMVINALNSGAKVFMADFEDSHSPTWQGTMQGQINLRDAVRGVIEYTGPEGKSYRLGPSPAVLFVRPRGWHLVERHVLIDDEPVSGALFDFAMFLAGNAEALRAKGSGAYFYLPKLENHLEARLWNEVITAAERELGLPVGAVRVTVLIETILAAFEMDEILWELRDHIVGLNCGRWDYIFSFIKKFRNRAGFVLPDRAQVTMTTHFLRSYSRLLIQTCHRRGAHAMGGMSAYIPVKSDPVANERALTAVRADKEREAGDGHDGTWVAHPGLVPVALEVFDRLMPTPNQIAVPRLQMRIGQNDLLSVPEGDITEKGLRLNVTVAIRYIESWLRGSGCVPIFNLMEDAATAEISRAQVWQWIRHAALLDDGRPITTEMVRGIIREEVETIRRSAPDVDRDLPRLVEAADLYEELATATTFAEFLTLPAYARLA
jgi:malate synthase